MDDVIILIGERITGHDEYGNEIIEATEHEVLCQVYGVTRNEFYSAAVANLHPEITVRLSDFEDYSGEKLVKFHDVLYSVVRTYRDSGSNHHGSGMPLNSIELTLERKVGNGIGGGESGIQS